MGKTLLALLLATPAAAQLVVDFNDLNRNATEIEQMQKTFGSLGSSKSVSFLKDGGDNAK